MSDVIELREVCKTYHRGSETVAAVDGITLAVPEGDFVAIAGDSGSGKTTLLNLIGCVDRPDAGVVRIDGEDVSRLDERGLTRIRARKIGFVFQQFFLLPTLTVRENVALPALFTRDRGAMARAPELLARVGLEGRARHLPGQLSGGEMQRAAIARALVNGPRILLADEPTGNLDSRNAAAVLALFQELNASGITIVMVTHSAELAARARRIVRLKDGRIESAGGEEASLAGAASAGAGTGR